MPRRYIKEQEEEFVENLLQKEIIAKYGDNKTNEKGFDKTLTVVSKDGSTALGYAFYTYRGLVCILDNEGMDVEFDSYDLKTQKLIHSEIMAGRYS